MQGAYDRQYQFFTDPIGFLGDTLSNYLIYAVIGLVIYTIIAIYKFFKSKSSTKPDKTTE